jgi:serine/threonine-protein kinase
VLFTIAAARPDHGDIAPLDLRTRRVSRLVRGGSDARYVRPGYLLHAAGDTLAAVRFDPTRLAVLGDSAPVVENVAVSSTGALNADITDTGMLLYLRKGSGSAPRSIAWVDRHGNETPLSAPPLPYASLRLSPDGLRLAVETRAPEPSISIWDLARQTLTPLTFNGGMAPVWTPDSQRVVFATAGPAEVPNISARAADGSGADTRLTTSVNVQVPTSITPDGRSVISVERRARTASDLVRVSLPGGADPAHAVEAIVETPSTEQNGEVSPDGRFLAYESNESGQFEVWVQTYPRLNGKWRVSTDGGTRPAWSRNGRELVYLDATNHLTIVPLDTIGSTLRYGTPKPLPTIAYTSTNIAWRTYDISADGQRFLVIKESRLTPETHVVTVVNFLEELRAKLSPPQ